MRVVFFSVDNVLNFPESDAVAPSGAKGVAEALVKKFKNIVRGSDTRIVLTGSWRKQWDFVDEMCTQDGVYLNKKLGRHGLHILDKTRDDLSDEDGIENWLKRHPNVTEYCILTDLDNVVWRNW